MKFSQHIVVYADDAAALGDLLHDWHASQAGTAPGFTGAKLLAFRDKPGRFVIQADFESWELAQKNNDRPETQEWAEKLLDLISGEPKYENLDVLAVFDS